MYPSDNHLQIKLKGAVFALKSTTVNLCLEVIMWAAFRSTKAAIKIHTLLELKTSIPEFIFISEGNVLDGNVMHLIPVKKRQLYLFA